MVLGVVATVVCDAALTLIVRDGLSRLSDPHGRLLLGLVLGQISTLAIWVATGRTNIGFSAAAMFAAAGLLSWPLAKVMKPDIAECFAFLCAMGLATALPLLVLRASGLSWSATGGGGLRRSWQFSLAGLVGVMTTSAFLLTAWRFMEIPLWAAAEICGYALGFSGIAWFALFIASLPAVWWASAAVVATVGLGAGAGLSALFGQQQIDMRTTADAGFVHAIYVFMSVLVVRYAGGRLGWTSRGKDEE